MNPPRPKLAPSRGWKLYGWLLPVTALFALIAFGISIFWMRGAKPLDIDVKATTKLQTFRNPFSYRLMTLVSSLGYEPTIHLLLISTVGLFWLAKRKVESLFALASGGAVAIVVLVKILVGRPRPSGTRIQVAKALPDYGFPSGHTVHYVSFYGFLAYLAATRLESSVLRWPLVALCALLIALVGPSRIFLGQHWLSDVVAAYLFGFAYLIGLIEVYERIKAKRSR